jgi:hypothetical protein
MTLPRRQFLHLAAGAAAITTFAESAIPTGARAQAPLKGVLPKRSARDRLDTDCRPEGRGRTRLPYGLCRCCTWCRRRHGCPRTCWPLVRTT